MKILGGICQCGVVASVGALLTARDLFHHAVCSLPPPLQPPYSLPVVPGSTSFLIPLVPYERFMLSPVIHQTHSAWFFPASPTLLPHVFADSSPKYLHLLLWGSPDFIWVPRSIFSATFNVFSVVTSCCRLSSICFIVYLSLLRN